MTGRRSHGRLSALNGVVHQGIGTATTSTSDETYDSFFRSPWMAPHVAIAADTPQIDTADDSVPRRHREETGM